MAMHTSWAAEVRWRDIGIADAADPWRARFESRSEAGWLSASILHDLRNPVGTIYAGAEMLMMHHTTPNQVKRLAANMHRAAGRMRELLTDLTSVTYGNRSTPEICDIREIIGAASDAAVAATDNQRVQILLDVPAQNKVAAGAFSYEADVLQLDCECSGSDAGRRRGSHCRHEKPAITCWLQ